jgi:hypothetical protein
MAKQHLVTQVRSSFCCRGCFHPTYGTLSNCAGYCTSKDGCGSVAGGTVSLPDALTAVVYDE